MRLAFLLVALAGCSGGPHIECLDYSFEDADGDGYGDPSTAEDDCEWTDGEVTNGDDCDDTDAAVSPGADEDPDGVDNDCDGLVDEERSLADADAKLTGEARGDQAGTAVAGAGDVDGDGFGDLLLGGPGHDAGATAGGATWVVRGPVSGEHSLVGADATLVGAEVSLGIGWRLAGPGDTDGDGYADLLIGGPYASDEATGMSEGGMAWLVAGPVSGTLGLAAADAILKGESGDMLGYALAGAGDVDADGHQDLLVGVPNADRGGTNAGLAALLLGPVAEIRGLDSADALLVGAEDRLAAGRAVSGAVDVDGDGNHDLLIGVPSADWTAMASGGACLALGPHEGERSLDDLDACWSGESENAYAGWSVAGLGDVDGDGYDDVGVGATGDDGGGHRSGAVYLLLGPPGAGDLSIADAKLLGVSEGDELGATLAGPGDVDGDGLAELLAGGPSAERQAGGAWLAWGPPSGAMPIDEAGVGLLGEVEGDAAGEGLSGAGDADGDGLQDLVVGAPRASGETGAAWLVLGASLGG